MNRNEYQRQWRKDKKLLNEYLNDNSADDDLVLNEVESSLEQNSPNESQVSCDENSNPVSGDSDGNSDESSEIYEFFINDFDEDTQVENLSTEVAQWVLRNKITRTASNELITILRKYGHNEELPKCHNKKLIHFEFEIRANPSILKLEPQKTLLFSQPSEAFRKDDLFRLLPILYFI